MGIINKHIVRLIPHKMTYEWLLHKHYAHRIPSITYAFGLYDENNLIQGVCTFGSPPSPALIQGLFNKQYTDKIIELNRLCINDNMPDNSASYFVSRCLKELPKPTIVVSYADTSMGHTGYIYQACNFLYTGLSAKRTEWKIKGLEHLHSKSISDGETIETLKNKYGEDFYYKDRPQKHRYIFVVANKRDYKQIVEQLAYPILPYPKGNNTKYDASYEPISQGILL